MATQSSIEGTGSGQDLGLIERPGSFADRTDIPAVPGTNRLLMSLPAEELAVIAPRMELLSLENHAPLHHSGSPFEYAYFPQTGLISLVVVVNDGRSVEVGLIGKEGMIGAPVAAEVMSSPYGAIVQAPLTALRIRADILDVLLPETPKLRALLIRFAVFQGMQVAQLAACNRLHDIDQRLARWLLMCQDRLGDSLLPMTHEFFAEMLGTGRPTVSVAAAVLQRAGFIQYSRGAVRIVDRSGLESAACECYRVIQQFTCC